MLWGFTVEAESPGRVLVNATKLVIRDVPGVAETLKHGYAVDDSRSAINRDRTKAFPKNTEIDVLLTFVTSSTDLDAAGNGAGNGNGGEGRRGMRLI